MKKTGVLLPIFSLLSKYGIGSFSFEAYEFVNFLSQSGVDYWQILPLVPIDDTYSPYQSCSTFAGNPLFIDLEGLYMDELLTKDEIDSYEWTNGDKIDYEQVKKNKKELLLKAYKRFVPNDYFWDFYAPNSLWLTYYSNYMNKKEGKDFNYYVFEQFIFNRQWIQLKRYANYMGIKIIGDLPIYVSLDSADVYYNQKLFQLENGKPKAVAGCPPDDFSTEGQMWGNPLYNWDKHKETNYRWWKNRIRRCFELYDVVRLDHFKGFDEYFSIPYNGSPKEGHWEKVPGIEFFNALKEEFGDLNIIAEDLGVASESLDKLLEDTGFPGMKVLQFAFNYDKNNFHLPNNYKTSNCVCYTGTHDNDTLRSFYDWELLNNPHKKVYVESIIGKQTSRETFHWDMIEFALQSKAETVIVPIQDILGFSYESRINTPGTVGNNWIWRLKDGDIKECHKEKLKELIKRYCN